MNSFSVKPESEIIAVKIGSLDIRQWHIFAKYTSCVK